MNSKLIRLSIMSLFLFSIVVSADLKGHLDNAKDAVKDGYDAVIDKAAELTEKLKHAGEDIKIEANNYHQTHKQREGETLEQYRARTQEDVYRRSNDAYDVNAVGGRELRDGLNHLYQDASSTWTNWEKSLGNKWKDFKQSLVDKVDDASDSIHDSFYDTVHDFQGYIKKAENKGLKYTDETKEKANSLLKDLKSSYENYKSATKAKYDQWSEGAKDKVEQGADKAKDKTQQAYEEAKAKYHQSRKSFADGMQSMWGSLSDKTHQVGDKVESGYDRTKSNLGNQADSISEHASDSYDSLKHGIQSLYNDASSTLNHYKEKVADSWRAATNVKDRGQSPADDFQSTINDFQHYQKVFEETGDKYSEKARNRIGKLLDDLKDKYELLKHSTKERVNSWTSTSDKGQSAALDSYNDAFTQFNLSKTKLQNEMSYASGKLDKHAHHHSVKSQIEDLMNDASKTLSTWKETLGDKWSQVTGGNQKSESSSGPEDFQDLSSNEFLGYLQAYENTKAQNTYTEEARIKLSDLVDDLQDKYQAFKKSTVSKWGGSSSDNSADKDKILQAYNQAKVGFYKSKGRLQDELDFLAGKLSEKEYDARVKLHDKEAHANNALKRAWRSVKNRLHLGNEEGTHIVRDYVKETVTEYYDEM